MRKVKLVNLQIGYKYRLPQLYVLIHFYFNYIVRELCRDNYNIIFYQLC